MGDYSSLYKYEKYEVFGDEIVPLGIFSVDGDGTMPVVVKYDCDQECGCQEPIYRWIQTDNIICIEILGYKLQATYSDSSTLDIECDGDSTLSYAQIIERGYPHTAMTSAVIGDCVTSIGDTAFRGCYSLTSVTIPNSVISIGQNAFEECSSLTSVVIPNGVASIGDYAFLGCGLTSITIPTSVTSIGDSAFMVCRNLASCTIGGGTIGNSAFYACYNLTNVTIESGVTSIGDYAFISCSGLTSVTVLAAAPPTLGDDSFLGASNLTIYVPCESVSAYRTANKWSDYATQIQGIPPCGQPTPTGPKFTLTLNDSSTVSAICDDDIIYSTEVANQYSGSVVSAVIGDCVTMIGGYAFSNCSSLTSVTIPNTVTLLNTDAFSHSGLLTLNIPDSVETIRNYAVYDCLSLTSVTIGTGVTTIGARAFNRSSNLQSIYVLATTPPTLGIYAFDGTNNCPIYVPSGSVSAYQSAWSSYASRIQAIP